VKFWNSRKSDSARRKQKLVRRSVVRKSLFETLEDRKLLSATSTPIHPSALFSSAAGRTATYAYLNSVSPSSSSNSINSSGPEGAYSTSHPTVPEVEPNNTFAQSQYIQLGNAGGVIVTGIASNSLDVDWYSFDLKAGDILDVRLQSNPSTVANDPFLSLYDSSRRELVVSKWRPGETPANLRILFPSSSPLTGSQSAPVDASDLALHYIVARDGRYFVRTSDLSGTGGTVGGVAQPVNYTMNIRRFRPVLESAPAGTVQKLYLDFEGGIVNRQQFFQNIPGSARLSPTRDFLQAYGLRSIDESRLIDAVVQRVQSKFDTLAANTTSRGFGLEILNSKDQADPWGEAHVSRVVIGGTFQELVDDPAAPGGLLGVAQSVDPGNFNTTETAIVMHDFIISNMEQVPLAVGVSRIDYIAEFLATVIAHEAGHYFGAWHQDPANATQGVMDRFLDPFVSTGSGPDRIFGNLDDDPMQFNDDRFSRGGGVFETAGINDTVNWIGWALPGLVGGGRVDGTLFDDKNLNRVLDSTDGRLESIRVYADQNNNGLFDTGELFTNSRADGSYRLPLPAGTHVVRADVPQSYRAVAPVSNSYVVTVADNLVNTGLHFGFQVPSSNHNGIVWNDTNGNGLRDAGEPVERDVWVYIDTDEDGRLDIGEPSVRTKSDGTYTFSTLPVSATGTTPGPFTVRIVMKPEWSQSFPGIGSNLGHTITLSSDPNIAAQQIRGLDFGVRTVVPVINRDYGDAPESYGVASHVQTAGLQLGSLWDFESASQFSATAQGDDNLGVDDEDGVELTRPLVRGSSENRVRVVATNSTGQPVYLNAWLDSNKNGIFEESELIFDDRLVSSGTQLLTFSIPATAQLGNTFARFRYSLQNNLGPSGESTSGEVEDYQFEIVGSFSLAVDDTASVRAGSSGNSIDVLTNDFRTAGETLTVVRTSGVTSVGGIASVSGDGSQVIYSPPAGFTGVDSFTYTMQNSLGETGTATVVVSVNQLFENPQALDDSFDVPVNGQDIPLNVLANDIEGQGGALSIISVTQPDKGGAISITTGGKSLRYTPARSFGGTESFTYTVMDASGARSTARVTLHTIPGARLDDQVLIQFVATDLSGNQISSIAQGQEFKIRVVVDDLRHDANNPGTSAGVFAAFMDMLYSAQLVSLKPDTTQGARFNFDVDFLNNYVNDTTGDASIPGVINEFGGANSAFNMNNPNPTVMAELTFTARAAGIANFMPDPADDADRSDTLLFNVSSTPVPKERIRYVGTQLQIFGDGVQFPQAVDDSANVAVNAVRATIDVLANDQRGSTGSVKIMSTTDGTRGTVRVENRNGNPADPIVTYSPNLNFTGFDQFTYVIQDSRGIPSIGTVSVRVGELAPANTTAAFDLVVTDLNGNSIEQIQAGQQFQLRGFVQDVRANGTNRGLFTAYMDVLYNSALVSPVLSTTNDPNLGFQVSFGPQYGQVREGDVRIPGIINEIGAQSSADTPLGSGQFLLFVVTMTANNTGTVVFQTNPADITPFHDSLTWIPAEPVTPDKIRFGTDQLRIVAASGGGASGEFHNANRPLDVNNDGNVSAIDALLVINTLNGIQLNGSGEGESTSRFFPDTSGDGRVSALDALLVINQLNSRSQGGSGEGEASGSLSAPLVSGSASGLNPPHSVVQITGQSQQVASTSSSIGMPGTTSQSYAAQVDLGIQEDEDEMNSIDDLLDTLAVDVNKQLGSGLAG